MLAFATFVFYAAFVFYQVFNLLNVRNLTGSVVTRETLANRRAFVAAGAVLVLPVAVVRLEVLQGFFTTADLTFGQWLAAAAIGSTVLWAEELRKALVRRRQRAAGR